MVGLLVVLLSILEVQCSTLSPDTGYPAWFSSLTALCSSSSGAAASFHVLFNLFFINRPTIRRFVEQPLRAS